MTQNELFVLYLFLASSITSFYFLTFVSCHAGIFYNFPFFLHCCFCFWNFKRLRHRNELVQKITVTQLICSFCSNVIFLVPFRYAFQSNSHRFVSLDNTNIFGLVFPNTAAAGFSVAICEGFTRHCCWHRNFQLSTSVFSWYVHLVQ